LGQLGRTGLVTRWVPLKGFRLLLNPSPYVASPFPRLGLAHWKASAVGTLVAGTRDPTVLRLLAETVL